VLIQKIKQRNLKFKEFKPDCDLVRMSHQSASFQTPAYRGTIPMFYHSTVRVGLELILVKL